MCNACGFFCCASDQLGECGCDSCAEVACHETCPDCGVAFVVGCMCEDDEYADGGMTEW